MPDELWTEFHEIVQEKGIKTIHIKEIQKAKWLSGEALQVAVKRREVENKGEKERYKHLNAEFQRIARIQYSCLENSMDRGAWPATVHRIKESDISEQLSTA